MNYRILVAPSAVYVKEADFFREQGGETEEWGRDWKPICADGIGHARLIGQQMEPYVSHHPRGRSGDFEHPWGCKCPEMQHVWKLK